jgi:hypothetical protein
MRQQGRELTDLLVFNSSDPQRLSVAVVDDEVVVVA